MLKPYADRVHSTYQYLLQTLEIVAEDWQTLVKNQQLAFDQSANQSTFDIRWQLDESKADRFLFKGFAAGRKPSMVCVGKEGPTHVKSHPCVERPDFLPAVG